MNSEAILSLNSKYTSIVAHDRLYAPALNHGEMVQQLILVVHLQEVLNTNSIDTDLLS